MRGVWTLQSTVRIPASARTVPNAAVPVRAAVADNELDLVRLLAGVHDQVAGLLRRPHPIGMPGHSQDVHPAGAHLYGEQDVQPLQKDRVHCEEVARQQASGLDPPEARQDVSRPSGAGRYGRARRIRRTVASLIRQPSRVSSP
jgi:hypothetical protein